MKYLKRFNESETIGEYPDRFTLTMKESPERAIKLIDENPQILKGRSGMVLKHACEHGMISIIKHILDNYYDLVSDKIQIAIEYTEESLFIDDNKKQEILDLLS
jgi:hypothetical protein